MKLHHSNTPRLLCLFMLLLGVTAATAWARAGGGDGYGGGSGGGGSGGGGSGGDGIGLLLYFLIRLCVEYPVIGVPLTIIVIVLFVVGGQKGQSAYQRNVIYRGQGAGEGNLQAEALRALQQADPGFNLAAFRTRLTDAFGKIQEAWCEQRLELVRPFVSDGIHERFSLQLMEQKDLGYRDHMEDLNVTSCQLAQLVSSGSYDALTVRFTASARDYRVDAKTGTYLSGSRAETPFAEYWTLLRRRGAQTKAGAKGLFEGHCPNCGVAVEMNQSANCTHCKALLRSGEHDWVLVEITQACEWRPHANVQPPGVATLQVRDPDFHPAVLEDRASVAFWRWTMAWRASDVTPLRKIASQECCDVVAQQIAAARHGTERSFYGECAVGSVETRGVLPGGDPELALVEVNWDGIRVISDAKGRLEKGPRCAVRKSFLVFSRKSGSRSGALNGVGSAHCPSCGAPESESAADTCAYCGAVLNDGSLGWNLTAVHPGGRPEVMGLLRQLAEAEADAEAAPVPAAVVASAGPASPAATGLLCWMVKVAQEDGQVDPRERELLFATAARRHVEPEAVEAMLRAAQDGSLQAPEPSGPEETRSWLSAMVRMALADGRITGEEWQMLRAVGQRLDLSPADLRLIVSKTQREMYQEAKQALREARERRSA